MRRLIPALVISGSIAWAGSAGETARCPNVVEKMVQRLEKSRIAGLTSREFEQEGHRYSYHLKTIDYLGTVTRDGRRYPVAAAQFLRSSAEGSEYPPARGHGFLIVFDDTFGIATYGRIDFADYHLEGSVLKRGDTVVTDFGTVDPAIRRHGWLLDSTFMPYPFADRISGEDQGPGDLMRSARRSFAPRAAKPVW